MLSHTLLFLNDRWFIHATPCARAPVVTPLVSWHLMTCCSRRSHITTHHSMHLRRRSLLRLSWWYLGGQQPRAHLLRSNSSSGTMTSIMKMKTTRITLP
jgi:hypothetical protein